MTTRRRTRALALAPALLLSPSLGAPAAETPAVRAARDAASGQVDVTESGRPVLRYNAATVQPPAGLLESVAAGNRKYAVPRCDYIHPLHGPDGEVLTHDWSKDHPHHRGVYWAWPEVDYGSERGDLHALQRVFARPAGEPRLAAEGDAARIEAGNDWTWENRTPIVREKAVLRVHPETPDGRFVDLRLELTALADGVTVARRGTTLYGGLNIRLSKWKDLQYLRQVDPAGTSPRVAWSGAAGVAEGGTRTVALVVLEKASNPDYPGDWIEYRDLPWFQPAFPATGMRRPVGREKPLVLEYRLWIRRGAPDDAACAAAWKAFNDAVDTGR
jgi:hypothetical protein